MNNSNGLGWHLNKSDKTENTELPASVEEQTEQGLGGSSVQPDYTRPPDEIDDAPNPLYTVGSMYADRPFEMFNRFAFTTLQEIIDFEPRLARLAAVTDGDSTSAFGTVEYLQLAFEYENERDNAMRRAQQFEPLLPIVPRNRLLIKHSDDPPKNERLLDLRYPLFRGTGGPLADAYLANLEKMAENWWCMWFEEVDKEEWADVMRYVRREEHRFIPHHLTNQEKVAYAKHLVESEHVPPMGAEFERNWAELGATVPRNCTDPDCYRLRETVMCRYEALARSDPVEVGSDWIRQDGGFEDSARPVMPMMAQRIELMIAKGKGNMTDAEWTAFQIRKQEVDENIQSRVLKEENSSNPCLLNDRTLFTPASRSSDQLPVPCPPSATR